MKAQVTSAVALVGAGFLGALLLLQLPAAQGAAPPTALFWLATLAQALLAAQSVRSLAAFSRPRWMGTLTAALFGLWLLYFWQLLVVAFQVPRVLLPPPVMILQSMLEHWPTLWRDFNQTVLKAVVLGWVLGSALGFAVALAIDRQPFLQRGLLPLASLTSTIPLVAGRRLP